MYLSFKYDNIVNPLSYFTDITCVYHVSNKMVHFEMMNDAD